MLTMAGIEDSPSSQDKRQGCYNQEQIDALEPNLIRLGLCYWIVQKCRKCFQKNKRREGQQQNCQVEQ